MSIKSRISRIINIVKTLAAIIAAPFLIVIALVAFIVVGTVLGIAAAIAAFVIYLVILHLVAQFFLWISAAFRRRKATRKEKIMATLYCWTWGIIALPGALKELGQSMWRERHEIWAEMNKKPEVQLVEG